MLSRWQTAAAIAASVVLFVPALFVSGIFAWLYDLLLEGFTGRSGEGIGFFVRGLQYAFGSSLSFLLPYFVLKRPYVVIHATVFLTLLSVLTITIVLIGTLKGVRTHGISEVLELVASCVGIFAGPMLAKSTAEDIVQQHKIAPQSAARPSGPVA
jgi:hypothetical protein